MLDRAEILARRVLERIGSKVDGKLAPRDAALASHRIGDLASRIEQLIESSLRDDEEGTRRVAPNRFTVQFTYEETSSLSPQYIQAVGKELTATVFEYINNRRYATLAPVAVTTDRDLFAKTTVVKAGFDDGPHKAAQIVAVAHAEEVRSITLVSAGGVSYQAELRATGSPAYIGRVAGNAVRIDDASVSRLHCSLSLRSGGVVVIADLGSANGTYVNDQILGRDEARTLKPGDVVGVGDLKLTVSEIS